MTASLRALALRHAEEASRLTGTPRLSAARAEADIATVYATLDLAAAMRLLAERLGWEPPRYMMGNEQPVPDITPEQLAARTEAAGCI